MKKILYILFALFALASCGKDDTEENPYVNKVTFAANLKLDGEYITREGEYTLYLFPDVFFTQTEEYSNTEYSTYPWKLLANNSFTLHQGSKEAQCEYYCISSNPRFTLNNVKKGSYSAIVRYKPSDVTFEFLYYYGYSFIDIKEENQTITFDFICGSQGKWNRI